MREDLKVVDRDPEMERPLHSFARAMAEDILSSSLELSGRTGSFHPPDVEALAEALVAAAVEAALTETRGTAENSQKSSAPLSPEPGVKGNDALDGKPTFPSGGATTDRGVSLSDVSAPSAPRASGGSRSGHPLMPRSGLPALGSLDYPDAPPTTPLLPETSERGDSFGRELKGGLAREFLPSPPPTTPKENQSEAEERAEEWLAAAAAVDLRVEFVERLVHRLSLEGGQLKWRDDLPPAAGEGGVGLQDGAKMAAYAEALSDDIIGWVTDHYPALRRARMREQIGCEDVDDDDDEEEEEEDGVHLLANRLAETIIASTMNEVNMVL